jgi:AmiR/NasT family two-component response regulator
MISGLAGLRVLLVEDEMLVCMDIEDMLKGFGCVIVGPAARVAQARTVLEKEMSILPFLMSILAKKRATRSLTD